MTDLQAYDVVEVISVPPLEGWPGLTTRSPRIGDTGTIVNIVPSSVTNEDAYLVECVGEDGNTIWLAFFKADQLRVVRKAHL